MTIYGVVSVCLLVAYLLLLVFYFVFSYADDKCGYSNNEVFKLKCIAFWLIIDIANCYIWISYLCEIQ